LHSFESTLGLGDLVFCPELDEELGIVIKVNEAVSIPPLVTVFWSDGHVSTQSLDDVSLVF